MLSRELPHISATVTSPARFEDVLKDGPGEEEMPAGDAAAAADDDLDALLEEMGDAAEEPAPVECFLPSSPSDKPPTLAQVPAAITFLGTSSLE